MASAKEDVFGMFSMTAATEITLPLDVRYQYKLTHTGDDAAAALTDSNQNWTTNELAGLTIYNKTDGSSVAVTSNTDDDVVGTLDGGTGDEWDEDDEYIVAKPDSIPFPIESLSNVRYTPHKAAFGGAHYFYAVVPEKYLIKLIGKGPLTAFATEAGTTELYDRQANTVAEKAAQIFFDQLADSGTGQDVEPMRERANRHLGLYEATRYKRAMPEQYKLRKNWGNW